MYCVKCGTKANDKFCPSCGNNISEQAKQSLKDVYTDIAETGLNFAGEVFSILTFLMCLVVSLIAIFVLHAFTHNGTLTSMLIILAIIASYVSSKPKKRNRSAKL